MGTQAHLAVTHSQIYAPYIDRKKLPQTEAAAREHLCLPISHTLSDEDVERIVRATVLALSEAIEAETRIAPRISLFTAARKLGSRRRTSVERGNDDRRTFADVSHRVF